MDSKSVIDTFKTCHHNNQTKWVNQRDKGVWRELAAEKKRWGNSRVQLHHVAAHADEKHKKGLRGPPTPIEQVNMYVDKLADSVYTDYTIGGLQTKNFARMDNELSLTKNKKSRDIGGTRSKNKSEWNAQKGWRTKTTQCGATARRRWIGAECGKPVGIKQ